VISAEDLIIEDEEAVVSTTGTFSVEIKEPIPNIKIGTGTSPKLMERVLRFKGYNIAQTEERYIIVEDSDPTLAEKIHDWINNIGENKMKDL